jgi:hypothetical protein
VPIVDVLVKLLKKKTFILEKFLDTAFQPPIRFFPESSDGFLNLRWNYSPLKEKAVQLPDGLSRFSLGASHGRRLSSLSRRDSVPPMFAESESALQGMEIAGTCVTAV